MRYWVVIGWVALGFVGCGDDDAAVRCGDGVCNGGESCETCAEDCEPCPDPVCGDEVCNGTEGCASCPRDCGACSDPVCGDGTCENPEDCRSCSVDCGACPVVCGDGVCDPAEDCASCPWDCGACPICGDGVCNGDDDCTGCPGDCGTCPPVSCGDGACTGTEECRNCPGDCGVCAVVGDGVLRVVSVEQVAQLTGQPSLNDTGAVAVYGTDLGSMFVHGDDRLYFLFGDTFGAPGHPTTSGDWRSNTMAWSTDLDPRDGVRFDGWIVDGAGRARALVEGDHAPNDGSGEVTKIPTCGWSDFGRMYVWLMSVRRWGDPGRWDVNFAELATSDDDGETWVRTGVQWPSTSNFIQVATVEHGLQRWFLGIPAGRFGGVKVARVDPGAVLDRGAYEYWAHGAWVALESAAAEVVPGPVGELSVVWNRYVNRWLMTYLNESAGRIELRQATDPAGPWSEPFELASSVGYPGLYGAFLSPWLVEDYGRVVYFVMSQWGPYNTFLMKATLERIEGLAP